MLTQEEIRKYRIELGLDPETAQPVSSGTPTRTSAPMMDAESRIKALRGSATPTPTEDAQTRIKRLRGDIPPEGMPGNEGVLASVARGLLTPFARAGVTAYNLVSSAGDLGSAAVAKYGADEDTYRYAMNEANKNVEKTRRLPFLGDVKPVGATDNITEGIKDIAGTGLEIGSTIIGGGEAKGALTGAKTVGKAFKAGLRYGAATNALYSAGNALTENKSLADTAKDAAVGAAVGAPLGAVSEVAAPYVGRAARGALRYVTGKAPTEAVDTAATRAITNEVTNAATPPVVPPIVKGETVPNALKTTVSSKVRNAVDPLADRNGITGRAARRVQQIADDTIENAKLSPVEREAVKVGIDKPDIEFIKTASPADQKIFKRMIEADDAARASRRIQERPASIAGETVINRVKVLEAENDAAGKALQKAVEAFPQKTVDVTPQYEDFVKGLEKNGIRVKNNGTLDFRNSRIAGGTGSKDRELLQRMYEDLRPNRDGKVLRDPRRVYRIRQKFFDELKLAKANDNIGSAEAVLHNTYKKLAEPLDAIGDAMNTGYKEARTKYAKTQDALDEFHTLMGKKWAGNLDESAKLRAGEVVQRILGNASASPYKTLNMIDDLLKQLGHNDGMNLTDQVMFTDMLERIFGTTQTRGLRGQVGQGVADAFPSTFMELAKKGYQAVKQITPEERKRALKQLLEQVTTGARR